MKGELEIHPRPTSTNNYANLSPKVSASVGTDISIFLPCYFQTQHSTRPSVAPLSPKHGQYLILSP